jgi:hypothetical protein
MIPKNAEKIAGLTDFVQGVQAAYDNRQSAEK